VDYYPRWFDYAAWIIAGSGALCFLAMLPEPSGRKRGLLKLVSCLLLAIGAAFGATAGILFNLRAPHLTARGEIFNVVIHTGKGSETRFRLRVPTGEIDELHLSSALREISDGETVEVVYQADTDAILHLRILDGPYQGYQSKSNSGMGGPVLGAIAAFALAFYGVLDWFTDGTAASSPSSDNQAAVDGDVDTASMLNLNSSN
jgi:hypothetical protein